MSRGFRFVNQYRCDACGNAWVDEWSCCCDDECSECGARDISPESSEDRREPRHTKHKFGLVWHYHMRFRAPSGGVAAN